MKIVKHLIIVLAHDLKEIDKKREHLAHEHERTRLDNVQNVLNTSEHQ